MMTNLLVSLRESDPAVVAAIAAYWGVDVSQPEAREVVDALHDAMLDPQQAARIWDKLDDHQRGALQALLSGSSKMPLPMFERMFGEIRKMGTGAVERDKPHENPTSDAEALFYRGLIYEGYEQAQTGARPILYVPPDLVEVLPTHKTAYDDLETMEEGVFVDVVGEILQEIDPDLLTEVHPADTSLVDDMATLLGYLQVYSAVVEEKMLSQADRETLLSHLLNRDDRRLVFLFRLGAGAELIDVQDSRAHPRRAETRRWLEQDRTAQLKMLADGWRVSVLYHDLWHVPGLHPEPTGWPYDPVVARRAVIGFLVDFVPQQAWWSLDEFIMAVKEVDPDFQRPSGDYESWYIRNDAGDYLNGFESWDAVEGALLEFYLYGPMHWLGLVDLAEDAARLTAYGRAFINEDAWPTQPDAEDSIVVKDDGTLLVSRRVPRFDRFQVMRFTTWAKSATTDSAPYIYKLNAEGIRRADEQGINTGHIAAFISRALDGAPIPPAIARLLETWQTGPRSSATLESLLVLRTTAPETLDFIVETPALRRYLGARLGPMAAAVRADQWEALRDALGERGIEVEVVG